MGYSQWIQIILENKTGETLKTSGTYLHWGKFYDFPDKDKEVPTSDINDKPIGPNKTLKFGSCGREDSPSGTEGQIDIMHGNERVFQLYWDCPYTGDNKFYAKYVADKWYPIVPQISTSGAIGTVTVKILYLGTYVLDAESRQRLMMIE